MSVAERHFDGPAPAAPIDWQQIAEHRRRRNSELEREVVFLRAERRRLERLLATTLRVASRDSRDCNPCTLLEVVAAITADQLDRPAYLEEEARARTAGLAEPLQETAGKADGGG